MKYPFEEAYDIVNNRFVPVPEDVQQRIAAELVEMPKAPVFEDALSSTLKNLKATREFGHTVDCQETVHKHGHLKDWPALLNALEDELIEKRVIALAPSLELPSGVPIALLVSSKDIGAIRAAVTIVWDETDWAAAHVGVVFTAVMTKQRVTS